MKMALGTFLCFAVDADGVDAATLISSALVHYRDSLDAAEPPVDIPSFLGPPSCSREVDLLLEPDLECLLRGEADKQQVPVERLLSHAVFLYLADRDRAANALEPP